MNHEARSTEYHMLIRLVTRIEATLPDLHLRGDGLHD